jgi:hypothetical protein
VKEETPTDTKVLAKYEYEGKPDVQDSIDVQDVPNLPPQEELQADNGVPTKYEYPHRQARQRPRMSPRCLPTWTRPTTRRAP